MSPTGMVLTVWRKSLVLSGKGFAAFDAKGNLVFRVDNYASKKQERGRPHGRRREAAAHYPVKEAEPGAARTSPPLLYFPSGSTRASPTRTKNSLHVTPVSCAASGGRYKVEGSYSQRRLAAVEPKAALGVDVFRLVVEPAGFDSAVAMAVVILLDQKFGSRGSLLQSF